MASLRDAFYSHNLSISQISKCEEIREAYFNLAKLLDRTIPKSRESSIAMTKLEESSMWAIKSIAVEHCVDADEDEIPEGVPMGEPYNDI